MAGSPLQMYGYNPPACRRDRRRDADLIESSDPGGDVPSGDDAGSIARALSKVLDNQGREMVTYSILNKRHLTDVDVAAFVQSHPHDEAAKKALASGEPLRKVALQSIAPDAFSVLQQARGARTYSALLAVAKRLPALRKQLGPTSPVYAFLTELLADPDFASLLAD
jgi:hypothetical protein